MRKRLRKAAGMLLAMTMGMGLLTGCGSDKAEAKELNVCIWDGMFGAEAIEKFEEDTGITVNVTYIDNTDTMLSRLIASGDEYDVVDIEAAYVKSFVDNGLLQEMDHSQITNEQYVEPFLLESGPIGDEEFKYTTPDSSTGYTTVIYNTETCPIEITSFTDLADPALEGEIAMVNSTISLYGTALVALGYSPDSTSEEEISTANDLLVDIKKNVKTFVGESATAALESGECSVAFCWDYSTLCFDSEENWDKFAVADLDNDCEKFIQYWGITAGCENTDLAHQFINYMISAEAVAMHIDEWGQLSMVQREYIEEYLPEGYYENPCIEKYEELSGKSWLIAVNDEQIALMDTYYTLLMGGN